MIKTSPNNSPPKNISSKIFKFSAVLEARSAKGLKTNARLSLSSSLSQNVQLTAVAQKRDYSEFLPLFVL